MDRVVFFVDGFNLYYSLIAASKADHAKGNYKWLDLKKYLLQFLDPTKEQHEAIYYFSAYYPWKTSQRLIKDPKKEARHRLFVKAIEASGIISVFGSFHKHSIACPICGGLFDRPEEKRTDVNIGVSMLKMAVQNKYDTAILVSGDTDFIPAVKAIKEVCPEKRVGVLFPYKRANRHFYGIVDFRIKTKLAQVFSCQLPNTITLTDGTIINCPPKWL